MPTDYAKLLEQNLYKYGHETEHLEVYRTLYSGRTHFIYELLQNAEDAGASKVRFVLRPSELEVMHNGDPFTEENVRRITGIGHSTKVEDLTKIGHFGIGFKSNASKLTRIAGIFRQSSGFFT